LEVAHKGVAVGVAHPSWVDTDLVRDAQSDLAGFKELLCKLPGPFGRVTPLRECAAAFVRAIERRKRKVYVPRTLAAAAAVRQLFASALADFLMARQTRKTLPQVEAEVRALGRPFGAHSMGLGAKPSASEGETREG
jgi:short-subunit dehydrogenase